jgi:hypothetical protein
MAERLYEFISRVRIEKQSCFLRVRMMINLFLQLGFSNTIRDLKNDDMFVKMTIVICLSEDVFLK